MARKLCPSCNKLTGGSSKQCSCGHVFATSSIVTPPTTKHCPACNEEQPIMLETCSCGHEFADIHELRAQLEDRARVGWAYVAFGGTALLVCIMIMIATTGLWIV